MPYTSNADLPDRVRDSLPKHAQDIYRAAFNSAYEQYDDPDERREGRSREETAHAVAWAAVGKTYEQRDGKWVAKDD